jgi:hypothetical protein
MTALSIQPPFPIFTDTDGSPLENGYIWIGTANLDPQGNPIAAYWDAALTITAAQPIRTSGGYPSRSGTPARLYVASDYSIRVQNKNGSVVYSAPAATERYSDVVVSGVNAEDVIYDPAGTGAVATTAQTKLRETISVTDYGAVADGTTGTAGTDNLLFFKAALEYLESQGGGTLHVPEADGIYDVSEPIIVRSNIELVGDGAASKIRNSVGTFTNTGDVVHIGISSEWVGWGNVGPAVTDASIAQFDAGDYSKLTTKNAAVRNIHVMTKAAAGSQGLGIWAVNATDFIIENIWSSNTATPVNVANDSLASPMACRNGVICNVFQVTSGRWYDLAYVGDAEFIDVSRCFNNPTDNSTLDAAITVGGLGRFNRIHNNHILFQNVGSKIGIELTGPTPATSTENYIYNNTIVKAGFGVIVFQMNNQSVYNNDFYSCTVGIRNYTTGTVFDSNTFFACTDDFDFKSGSSCTVTNSALTFSKLTGDTAALVAQQIYRNCFGFGGVKQRVYWGTDYVISAPDIANVTVQNAFVQFAAAKTTELYFRLPDNLYELQELLTYWYAGAAGEVLTQKLYKREAFGNFNTWVQVGSTQTYTSSGVGDQTASWTGIGAVVTNVQTFQPDQYYVELQVVNANANTQLRGSQITYNTTGTLN